MKSVSFWYGDVSTAVLTALVDLLTLTRLDISATKVGDDAAAIISRMEWLEQLSGSSHFARRGLEQSEKSARRLLPQVREITVVDAN